MRHLALFALLLTTLPAVAQSPRWRTGYDAALAEAKQSGKPVLLDFTADWCGACKVLDTQAFQSPAVARVISSDFIAVRVDLDRERDLADRFEVSKLPTLVVVTPDGRVRARRTGSATADEIMHWLNPLRARTPVAAAPRQPVAAPPPRPAEMPADPWVRAYQQLALDLRRKP